MHIPLKCDFLRSITKSLTYSAIGILQYSFMQNAWGGALVVGMASAALGFTILSFQCPL